MKGRDCGGRGLGTEVSIGAEITDTTCNSSHDRCIAEVELNRLLGLESFTALT